MRALKFFLSALLFVSGLAIAVTIAAARYGDVAQHALSTALLLTASSCAAAACAVRLVIPSAAPAFKIALFVVLAVLAVLAGTAHCVGIDGILPRRDGSQSIGLAAIAANADLFALVIVTTAASCHDFLGRLRP